MKWAVVAARVLLALPLLVFGLDGFFAFLPRDIYPEHGARAEAFLNALVGSGYAWPLIKTTEVLVALALLSGRFVPLALVIFAPVLVNIVGFHLTMEREGTGLAFTLAALTGVLAWSYRASFRPLLAPERKPFSTEG